MPVIFFDDDSRSSLLPLTFTRPVAELRVGILTIREKWNHYLSGQVNGWLTENYLASKFPVNASTENLLINGSVLPSEHLVAEIKALPVNSRLLNAGITVAFKLSGEMMEGIKSFDQIHTEKTLSSTALIQKITHPWDIFSMNDLAIKADFEQLTAGRKSQQLSATNKVIGEWPVFLEEGAKAEFSFINTTNGPVYLGKSAEVMEGCMIRGPFSLGDHAQLKMGAKIYGPTTIGPHCKVGGELNNSVLLGFSNKAHDGFLGNSVIGEWCNIGADSNNSNLKNNYSTVKMWSYKEEGFISTGLQFCGLVMGDHSKCSINTMFNTGTVVGVSANVFGTGFPPKFIPSFSWGGSEGFTTFRVEEAIGVAQRVFERRNLQFDQTEQQVFKHLFDHTTKYRSW
jgi:UDP-N-acetylglucosamine diphosphorylase/glucosamine-1-phosphate N-acetyltransferase